MRLFFITQMLKRANLKLPILASSLVLETALRSIDESLLFGYSLTFENYLSNFEAEHSKEFHLGLKLTETLYLVGIASSKV